MDWWILSCQEDELLGRTNNPALQRLIGGPLSSFVLGSHTVMHDLDVYPVLEIRKHKDNDYAMITKDSFAKDNAFTFVAKRLRRGSPGSVVGRPCRQFS